MKSFFRFYIAFLIVTSLFARSHRFQIQVLDIWSGQPVPAAFLIINNDTLRSNKFGMISVIADCSHPENLKIQAKGYFAENLKCTDLRNEFVYLTPLSQTAFITVIRSRVPSLPLNIPSHQSHLNLNDQPVLGSSAADLLQSRSGLFLKSYGPDGTLQTIAIRGMAAEQTQISFDGIPLNNLQLGSADLSQLTVDNLQSIDMYRGSNVILGGSGAIGGSLNLNPLQPAGQLKIRSKIVYSSLKNTKINGQFHVPYAKLNLRSLLTFAHANGLNHYSTVFQGKRIALRNRDFRQNHLSYQILFHPKKWGQFKFFISHFNRHAGAPKAFTNPATEEVNKARMSVNNTLSYLRWQQTKKHSGFYAQGYVRNEWMTYSDPATSVNFKPLHSIHFNQEQGLQVRFHYSPRQTLLFKSGVEMARQFINSSEAGSHKRQRQAFYLLSDLMIFERPNALQAFHLNGGLRIEHFSRLSPILLPVIGASFEWYHTQIYASAGKNFRIPGFNDLYWIPGGNPDLKPEFSKNFESGLRQMLTVSRWLGQFEISAYQNIVQDQIRWLPGSSGYWTPKNISRVRSRGLEFSFQWAHVSGKHKIRFSYTFGRAIKQKAETANDLTAGNQIPFLPQEQWGLFAQTGWRRWRTGMLLRHTGFRYTDFSNDSNSILPSFTTGRIWLQGKMLLGKTAIVPEVIIENILNQSYQVLKGFPMPGRYVQIGCSFEFNAK